MESVLSALAGCLPCSQLLKMLGSVAVCENGFSHLAAFHVICHPQELDGYILSISQLWSYSWVLVALPSSTQPAAPLFSLFHPFPWFELTIPDSHKLVLNCSCSLISWFVLRVRRHSCSKQKLSQNKLFTDCPSVPVNKHHFYYVICIIQRRTFLS